MKKIILSLIAALGIATGAQAAGGDVAWDKAPHKLNDLPSLQNGAKLFVNYCLSCHSAAYMRFNRLRDIGLTEQQIKDNMLFSTNKVGDTMKAAIDPNQAKEWFGANPPDLTLIARSRSGHAGTGADYLYTYLRTYYRDPTKATGWNNLVFPSVGMPHVLWELQGEREPQYETRQENGHEAKVFKGWKQLSPGTMTPLQYDAAVADLVGYLQWMAEPAQNSRVRVGVWVLLFLGVFTIFAWRLNAAYWKNI
ncbi:MAG: cytochrome [Ramlibacter sp.]|jgi:ubiquinol-cytochrome c reductase cytochrome c1 subunit|nr:cytochrome [Ramlibacter sp.]